MLGKAKYIKGQRVEFIFNQNRLVGKIYIIDAHGTFGQDIEVSYDIISLDGDNLYKHVIESQVTGVLD